MYSKGSRYEQVPTHQATAGGRTVTYTRLRLLPNPPAPLTHTVSQGERLDQIAHRYFQDSEQFWRIADANATLLPSELVTETGRRLRIPLPQR